MELRIPESSRPSRPVMTETEVIAAVLRLRHLWALALAAVWMATGLGALAVVAGLLGRGLPGGLAILVAYAAIAGVAAKHRRPTVRALGASIVIDPATASRRPASEIAQRWRKKHLSALTCAYIAPTVVMMPVRILWPSDDPTVASGIAMFGICVVVYVLVTRHHRRGAGLDAPRFAPPPARSISH